MTLPRFGGQGVKQGPAPPGSGRAAHGPRGYDSPALSDGGAGCRTILGEHIRPPLVLFWPIRGPKNSADLSRRDQSTPTDVVDATGCSLLQRHGALPDFPA